MSLPSARFRYRGIIWPAMLIAIGAVALLVNANVMSSDRLYRLVDLWPLVLIVTGLQLFVIRTPMPANAAPFAAILILLLAGGGAVAYVAAGPAVPPGIHTIDTARPASTLDHASVELDVGAATLKIVGADLGGSQLGDLFRAHIEYSGPSPEVSFDKSTGRLKIFQSSAFHLFVPPQRFVLNLQLSSQVRWRVAVHSGSATDGYDLTKLQLASLEVDTGSSREDIALGTPKGNVPISIHGGALTVVLHRPSGIGADVNVSGGAVSLDFDGRRERAVGSVSSVGATTEPVSDMFTIRVNGSACTVTVDANSPALS